MPAICHAKTRNSSALFHLEEWPRFPASCPAFSSSSATTINHNTRHENLVRETLKVETCPKNRQKNLSFESKTRTHPPSATHDCVTTVESPKLEKLQGKRNCKGREPLRNPKTLKALQRRGGRRHMDDLHRRMDTCYDRRPGKLFMGNIILKHGSARMGTDEWVGTIG